MLSIHLQTYDGESYALPMLLEWTLTFTGSVPCDSMSAVCLYHPDMARVLPKAVRFTAVEGEQVMLRGVVDAYEIAFSGQGMVVTVEGRGMAALLLDNEAEAVSYGLATLAEIIANHVTPYGIRTQGGGDLAMSGYAVTSGSSQWKAVREFVRRCGGFEPYFTRDGTLAVQPLWRSGRTIPLGDDTPMMSLKKREQRYGVISEMLIKDKHISQQVVNEPFAAVGGQRRHVLYMPRSTAPQRRYTGEYQIAQSELERVEIDVTLPLAFAAFPGDRAEVTIGKLGLEGTYEVVRSRSEMNEKGQLTVLTLSVR